MKLLFFVFVSLVFAQTPLRQFIVEEDYFRGFKAREFSIYYPTKDDLKYRIESSWFFHNSIRLDIYPSKKTIGKLSSSKKGQTYRATLKIRSENNKKWIKGQIQQHHRLLGQNWTIQWNGSNISMISEPASLVTSFYDDQTLLARFRLRLQSFLWVNLYDIEFFTDQLPDSIFLLSLALKDHVSQWKTTN